MGEKGAFLERSHWDLSITIFFSRQFEIFWWKMPSKSLVLFVFSKAGAKKNPKRVRQSSGDSNEVELQIQILASMLHIYLHKTTKKRAARMVSIASRQYPDRPRQRTAPRQWALPRRIDSPRHSEQFPRFSGQTAH